MSTEGWFIVTGGGYSGGGGAYADSSTSVGQGCKSVLAYSSQLSTTAAGSSSTYADQEYPIDNLFDDLYSTEFSPDDVSAPDSVVLTFEYVGATLFDYFAMVSTNAEESGLNVKVEVRKASTETYETVAEFTQIYNGRPIMVYFGYYSGPISCSAIRITLTYTAKPYIMAMRAGKAVVLPRTFSLGVQPAHLSPIDEVRQFEADEGLNIVGGRRLARGYRFSGKINSIRMDFVQSFWRDFTNHVLNSKPFFLMWNTDLPDEIIFGVQTPSQLTKPKYKTSLLTEIDCEVTGWA